MRPGGDRRRRACSDDGGAVLVEFALALPILAVLAMGLMEYGMMFYSGNQAARAVQNADRIASRLGDGRTADFETLRSLDSSLNGLRRATIDGIIVYKASAADGTVPTNCTNLLPATGTGKKGVSGVCNVYSTAQMQQSSPIVGFTGSGTCVSTDWDANYCPADRNPHTLASTAFDYVGVFVRLKYQPFTGIFPSSTRTMDRAAVYRVEPKTS